jgi:uncharacterized membrane protein (UPF0127 family)
MGLIQGDQKRIMRAVNQTRGTVLCACLEGAGGLKGKSRGLLGRERLEPGAGMLFEAGLLEPFMCMHMMFMRFPIDVVFLNRDDVVIRVNHNLRPWHFSSIVWRARRAMEIEAGAASASSTQAGDKIVLEWS